MKTFSWIPIYREIGRKLLIYRDDQQFLIDLIEEMKGEKLIGKNRKKLDKICPFTFFQYITSIKNLKKWIKILNFLKTNWNLDKKIPKNRDGLVEIPNSIGYFSEKIEDIENLWELFEQSYKNGVKESCFETILTIGEFKNWLTVALYWANPTKFLPINKDIALLLKDKYGVKIDLFNSKNSYKKYLNILSEIKDHYNKNSIDLVKEGILKIDIDKNIVIEKKELYQNTIFYGAPGTGKSYDAYNFALKIFGENDQLSKQERVEKIAFYREKKQLEVITFHPSFGYEEFIEGIRAKVENGGLNYSVEDGVLKKIAKRSLKNYKESKIDISTANRYYKFDILIKNFGIEIEENFPFQLYKMVTISKIDKNGFKIEGGLKEGYLKFEILKHLYINGIEEIEKIVKDPHFIRYYRSIFEKLINFEKKSEDIPFSRDRKIDLKNYVLIIDEINRGDINRVFGELLTTIEPSKRFNSLDQTFITLPYSKESFILSNNFYIIGTMNRADRSVQDIDIALRRRFQFIEKKVDYSLLSKDVDGVDLSKLLKALNEKIDKFYSKEFLIGHTYFLKVKTFEQLKTLFKREIFPLLEHYFFNNFEKIGVVLNDQKEFDQNFNFIIDYKGDKKINYKAFDYKESYVKIYR